MPTGPPGPPACGHLVAPCDGAQGSVRLAAPTWSPASCVLDAMRRAAPSVRANSELGTIATTASWLSIVPSSPASPDTERQHRNRMPIPDRGSVQQIVPGMLSALGSGLLGDHFVNGRSSGSRRSFCSLWVVVDPMVAATGVLSICVRRRQGTVP